MSNDFMQSAVDEARFGINHHHGGPFGAVIVKENKIIARGHNTVLKDNDPTSHAEMNAIRQASKTLNNYWLQGCEIYTTCEPCPMCLSAIYWARVEKIYFSATRQDAARIGFDDSYFYDELQKQIQEREIEMKQCSNEETQKIFEDWLANENKVIY